ncbi:MAG: 3-phosphoglycerate dehydrogenase [Tenericutes bacterium]|nr:3-phosphoglycerate dehydrogenase [Mycoplasmatota bacterium]
MKVGCLNNISAIGLGYLTKDYQVMDSPENADLIIVRSASMHDYQVNDNLIAIARAGAGVNNIPLEAMASKGVVVFNTPGANANGVKEIVIASMLLASRDIVGGINWVKNNLDDENILKNIEKAKKAFAGTEILGKTISVIGLGAIGGKVANACFDLGLKVYGYDPYASEKALKLLKPGIEVCNDLNKLYEVSDFISLHLPLLDSTRDFFNEAVAEKVKKGLVLLNFSRDGLVKDSAIELALSSGTVAKYVTDFPSHFVANLPNVIAIPHLGASTEESEVNCSVMAAKQLMAYSELGEIINSVNFPNVELGSISGTNRMVILAKNNDSLVENIDKIIHQMKSDVKMSVSKFKNDYGVFAYDFKKSINPETLEEIKKINGVLRLRYL